jgi:hypothetical protein
MAHSSIPTSSINVVAWILMITDGFQSPGVNPITMRFPIKPFALISLILRFPCHFAFAAFYIFFPFSVIHVSRVIHLWLGQRANHNSFAVLFTQFPFTVVKSSIFVSYLPSSICFARFPISFKSLRTFKSFKDAITISKSFQHLSFVFRFVFPR